MEDAASHAASAVESSGAPVDREPLAEVLLYLQWIRGATGRFLQADAKAPVARAGAPAGGERQVEAPVPGAEPRSHVPIEHAPALSPAHGVGDLGGTDDLGAYDRLRTEALACRRCGLCESRTTVVFGEGKRRPRLMVVGEAPGADEDRTGRPFVGRAGQLLTRMLAAIGLAREDVYIGNVLKCRPPDNRPPRPDEVAACRPFLLEQMRLLDPALVLVLGNAAAKAVLGTDRGISSMRGRILSAPDGRPVLPTYHPAYLLRNPAAKRETWLDLQLAARTLGLSLPDRPARAGGEGPPGATEGADESEQAPPA